MEEHYIKTSMEAEMQAKVNPSLQSRVGIPVAEVVIEQGDLVATKEGMEDQGEGPISPP